jgi:outer membrane protein assembly factor BamE (lipoprotein component of BamABCDE complex)
VVVVLLKIIPALILGVALTSGCQVTTGADTQDVKNTNLTVGLVQQNINVGTSATDVLRVLGSPNIVKKSKNRGEVWVYDKFSTEQISQNVSGSLVLLKPAVGPGVVGGGSSRTTSSTSTLTIILTFDENDFVQDVAYHRARY